MKTTHVSVAEIGPGISVRVRLMVGPFNTYRVDVRRFDGLTPGAGFNVSARHAPALRRALEEIEAAAARQGLTLDAAA